MDYLFVEIIENRKPAYFMFIRILLSGSKCRHINNFNLCGRFFPVKSGCLLVWPKLPDNCNRILVGYSL